VFVHQFNKGVFPRRKTWGTLFLGIASPLLIYLAVFSRHFPIPKALSLIIGYNPNWMELNGLYLYQNLAGFISWQSNVKILAVILAIYLAVFLTMNLLCAAMRQLSPPAEKVVTFLLAIAVPILLSFGIQRFGTNYIFEIFFGQSLLIIMLAMQYIKKIFRVPKNESDLANILMILILCSWSLFLLLKVPLRSGPVNYGLFFSMPGILTTTAFLTFLLPAHFERRFQMGWHTRILISAILMFICTVTQFRTFFSWQLRTYPVGQGANRIFTTATSPTNRLNIGPYVNEFLEWSKNNMRPQETFVTFPQGIMLNFLTGHLITGPHTSFMTAEMATYSEVAMLKPLISNPPDYFIYVNHDTTVSGNLKLGQEYGSSIFKWVNDHYVPVWQTGPGFGSSGFGIEVLKKK
jgi:hypothetical protein